MDRMDDNPTGTKFAANNTFQLTTFILIKYGFL